MAKSNKKRKKHKQPAPLPQKNKPGRARIIIGIAVAIAAFFIIAGLVNGWFTGNKTNVDQINALKQYVFSEPVQDRVNAELAKNYTRDDFIVFLSVCDTGERARVVNGVGNTLEEAWDAAEENAKDIDINIVWAKADIVFATEEIQESDLDILMRNYANGYPYFLRLGVAFDSGFDMAFLEAEMNGNRLYRYLSSDELKNEPDPTASRLNLKNINNYLETYYPKATTLKEIPEVLTIFTTIGFFCDDEGKVFDLYGEAGVNTGRRIIDELDADHAYDVMLDASKNLYGMIKPDGEYVYGYYAYNGEEIDSYNILRHAGSIWSLINLYRVTKDESIIKNIDAAIEYLLDGYLVYKEPDTAYIVERKSDEVKLGGNGLTVIMLSEYMTVFETDKYIDIIKKLANGILELQDSDTGKYFHVLNYPDFSPKEEFRTIYYDGEATFALTRTYTFTKDKKYLDAAALAVDNFIAEDYTRYRDHWVAYSLNEITMYIPEPRYYEFALRNAGENLERMISAQRTHPTYLELLMAVWQTHERMVESGIQIEYANEFDMERFAETIYLRAFHMLNAYFYPEYVMYMMYPDKFEGSVFIRDDRFRVRIDDIQHFIGGFYFYYLYYDDIRAYLSDEFIHDVNQITVSSDVDETDEDFEE